MADLAGIDPPASADDLVAALGDLPGQLPTCVVVDALDEAASDEDRQQITRALAGLAALPALRVAVATRPLAAADPYNRGGLLAALGVAARSDPGLVDLDSDAYFDRTGLRRFAAALLALPGRDGGAWQQYRARRAVRERLAAVIADRARRNFLVAAMAASQLSDDPEVIDPTAGGFDPAQIPSRIGEALSKYLDGLPEERRERVRAALTALAYARGGGVDDPAWLAFAGALGYPVTLFDLEILRHSRAADYLLQVTPASGGARPVTRLFHQALADELLTARNQVTSDESLILNMLLDQAKDANWQVPYLREHAAEHAAAGGRLDELLADPHYLLAVSPGRLVPHLDTARSGPARATAIVYWQSAHRLAAAGELMRASQLELTAHRLGHPRLAASIAACAPRRPWQVRWSHGHRITGQQVIRGHSGMVDAVAVAALPDGTPAVISGGRDGTVRVWRLPDGTPACEPINTHLGTVWGIAPAALPDGTPVIISGGDNGVRVWRLADGTPVGEAITGHEASVRAVAAAALPDGTAVIISGGYDCAVRVWRLADGTPVGEPITGHSGAVYAVAAGALPDGTPVIISGSGYDNTMRVWRLADGTPVGEPMSGRRKRGSVWTVTAGTLPDGTPVAVSGSSDGTMRTWRLADGTPAGKRITAHSKNSVDAVAAGALPDGTPVIISGGDETIRVWRLADGTPVGEPLNSHGNVRSLAAGALPDGTPIAVSGGTDGTVRVWRIADAATPSGNPLPGHRGQVRALATGTLPDGTPVIISGGDVTVGLWRLVDGSAVAQPLTGHDDYVNAVAAGVLPDGTPVAVSGGSDGTIRLWRLADGTPAGRPMTSYRWSEQRVLALAVAALPDGTPVIISSGDARESVWRLADGSTASLPSANHGGSSVNAVAAGRLPDGTPVMISGGDDGTIQVCRLADGSLVGEPVNAQQGWVRALAAAALPDGAPVIISGGTHSTVRLWRLADGTAAGKPLPGHDHSVDALAAAALPDGTPVIISGGDDHTVRVWRLADGLPLVPPLDLPDPVGAVAAHDDLVIVATGADIAVLRPAVNEPDDQA